MKSSRLILIAIIALGLPAFSAPAPKPANKPAPAAKPAEKVAVLPGTALALPADSKVKVRWVCPPLDAKAVDEARLYETRFVVDSAGRPWLGTERDDIVNPTEQYKFTFQHLYEDIACLENGTFLVATSSDLGLTAPPNKPDVDYDGIPLVHFQPIAGLPIPGCKLFPGAGNCLYLAGRNPETEQYEVYLLKADKLTIGGTGVREYVKVFSSKREISAVAGDGDRTYVAVERVILKVLADNSTPTKVYVSPKEVINELAYDPQVGLFYADYSGIGYIGASGNLQLMAAYKPDIYLQKGSLYVLFPKTLGVLALDNIGDLKRFNLAFKEVPATQSSEVKVTDIRFFEAGETPPEYPERNYVTKFDKAVTRYVYCQINMLNLLQGKREHKQKVTMELEWPGGADWTDMQDINLNIKSDLKEVWGWARFGNVNPGALYPGVYTVKTYLNGGKIDERRFTVEGEPNVLEAASNSDTASLSKLLDEGADPNTTNVNGWTPLMMAVSAGCLENVRLLLEHKADANLKNIDGETALIMASWSYHGNPAMVKLLLEHGADANAVNNDGETALHLAADSNELDTMRLLLEHGADPNLRDKDQSTPLQKLTLDMPGYEFQAKPEHIELLLSHGADVNAMDSYGDTALYDAIRGKDPAIVRTLLSHGADVNIVYKYDSGTQYTILGHTLISYNMERDRLSRDRFREIIGMLCEKGANLIPDEVSYAITTGTINLLSRKQIVHILDNDYQAVFSYQPEDPWLRKYVLSRLMSITYNNISWANLDTGFQAALDVCKLAKDRAEQWGMETQFPDIYFNCGFLSNEMGYSDDARAYLQRYLELAPNGVNVEKARGMLGN